MFFKYIFIHFKNAVCILHGYYNAVFISLHLQLEYNVMYMYLVYKYILLNKILWGICNLCKDKHL